MKKRKPPILLVSILFVLGGAMVVYGIKPWEQSSAPSQEDILGQERNTPDASAVKSQVVQVAKGAKHGGPVAPAPATTISIKEQSGVFAKPKPPTSGRTNSQWYETGH